MSLTKNASLEQQGRLGPVRQFQIVNGKEIRIKIKNKARQQSYAVQLLALADKGHLRIHIAWHWLILIVICGLSLIGYYLGKVIFEFSLAAYEFSITAGLGLTGLLALVLFLLNISRKRVFVSRYAKVDLFEILISNPDYRSYKTFLDTLSGNLQKARQFWDLKPEHQIAGEMRMLRRLASQGIITESVYQKAKDKLFSMSDKKSR
ncbi:hypothetical protein MNBD_GAMMA21-943 [hydrothermal vent metagenome]|uniref:SHOCT domain-containing protein n=1 Tax=hydrothermal vent metagenome TaxID=652676 RepID=A0A3B0ZNP0_9ZZZZ